jgi:hypothetical protein
MIASVNSLKIMALLIFGAVQLPEGRSVAGTVRLPGGEPAAGVRVVAMVAPGVGRGGRTSSVLASLTQTDKDGHYRLEDIPPGRYFIAAGAVASPTFFPGTTLQNEAQVVSITQGGAAIAGIDFAMNGNTVNSQQPSGVNPLIANSSRPCCDITGLILTDDGHRLPTVPLKINSGNNTSVSVDDDGLFHLFVRRDTTAQLAIEGLPPGYFLKTVVYGGMNATPNLLIDGRNSLILVIDVQPGATFPSVTARGKVSNLARELNVTNLSLVLTPTITGETFMTPVQPDSSFEYSRIPVGSYRAAVRDAAGNTWPSPTTVVIREAVSDLKIDFGNNPFPDLTGLPGPLFAGGKEITITGVATQRFTGMSGSKRSGYFRMDVKDERTGVITSWAIYVSDVNLVANIVAGQTYTVTGTAAHDGTSRLIAKPF